MIPKVSHLGVFVKSLDNSVCFIPVPDIKTRLYNLKHLHRAYAKVIDRLLYCSYNVKPGYLAVVYQIENQQSLFWLCATDKKHREQIYWLSYFFALWYTKDRTCSLWFEQVYNSTNRLTPVLAIFFWIAFSKIVDYLIDTEEEGSISLCCLEHTWKTADNDRVYSHTCNSKVICPKLSNDIYNFIRNEME